MSFLGNLGRSAAAAEAFPLLRGRRQPKDQAQIHAGVSSQREGQVGHPPAAFRAHDEHDVS
jgi:hypothetical protein